MYSEYVSSNFWQSSQLQGIHFKSIYKFIMHIFYWCFSHTEYVCRNNNKPLAWNSNRNLNKRVKHQYILMLFCPHSEEVYRIREYPGKHHWSSVRYWIMHSVMYAKNTFILILKTCWQCEAFKLTACLSSSWAYLLELDCSFGFRLFYIANF